MSDPNSTRDPIDEAIEESFPASDPPEWTGMHAGAPAGSPGASTGRGTETVRSETLARMAMPPGDRETAPGGRLQTVGTGDRDTASGADLETVRSAFGVSEAAARIEHAVTAAGMKVFARIDHAAEARSVGLSMHPAVVVIFGNPAAGTPLMAARPTSAIDLPLKALVWEDDRGATWLTYSTPDLLIRRHGLDQTLARKLAPAAAILRLAVSP